MIALHEVESVLDTVDKANAKNTEVETTLEIEARGGKATLRVEKKSRKRLRNAISTAEWKRNGFLGLCSIVVIWGGSSGHLNWGIVIVCSIFGLPLLWALWEGLDSDLKRANKELESYERARNSVFLQK